MNVTMLGNDYGYNPYPRGLGWSWENQNAEPVNYVNADSANPAPVQGPTPAPTSTQTKTKFSDNVNTFIDVLKNGVGVYNDIKGDPTLSDSDRKALDIAMKALEVSGGNAALAKQNAAKTISTQNMLLIGGGVAAVVIVAIILSKKKSRRR
jgi:hypothetical protein